MTSRTTKVRNSSAKSGSSLLTAARYRRRLTCSASLPGTHGAVRAGPSICRPRGYIGTALQKPDGGSAHRRYILVEATADLLGFPAGNARGSPCRAFNLPTAWVHRNRSAKTGRGSAHRRYILVEAEEIGWIVLGLEFNQPCIIASERCPYRVWFFIADEIQQVAVA